MEFCIDNLNVWFATPRGPLHAVENVSFGLERGETLCLVGESGSGKSVTCFAALGLLPRKTSAARGSVRFQGEELLGAPEKRLRKLRGGKIGMIFQDPMVSLNPVRTVGWQMEETLGLHRRLFGAAAREEAVRLLDRVGISAPESRLAAYPHQLSGGMCQRVMIAMVLAGKPDLIIADEPTTALDVTIQNQILKILKNLCTEDGVSLILVTHDLGVVARMADRVAVMYAGNIVEKADVRSLFYSPGHPYTNALLSALPRADTTLERLRPIPGQVPPLHGGRRGCMFHDRCEKATAFCAAHSRTMQGAAALSGSWNACLFASASAVESVPAVGAPESA